MPEILPFTPEWAIAFLETLEHDLRQEALPSLADVATLAQVIPTLKAIVNDPCLQHLKPGEPFWVARAQDDSADVMVDNWCDWHEARLGSEHPKIVGGRKIAEEMRAWPSRKDPD